MKIISTALPRNYELCVSGDIHIGSPCTNIEHVKEMVNYVVNTDNCYMVNIGDNIEAISPSDKRFQFSNCEYQTIQDQANAIIELFKPLKRKLLAIGTGNHEYKHINEFNIGRYIADQLDVPFGSVSYKLEVYDDRTMELMHKMFMHHGAGCVTSNSKDDIQAEANMKASVKNKLMKTAHADCIVHGMGHIHRSLIVEPTAHKKLHLTTENGKIKQHYRFDEPQNVPYIAPDSRFYFSNPSFMKLYGDLSLDYCSYAENFMYSPSEIGYSKIIVNDGKVQTIEFVKL